MATAQVSSQFSASQASSAQLQTNLQKLARRRNFQIMARSLIRAAIPGVLLAAISVLAYRFYLVDGAWWMPVAMIVVALLFGARRGRLEQRGAFSAAVEADQKLDWDDRLSSALAFVAPNEVRSVVQNKPKNWRERLRFAFVSPLVIHTAQAGHNTNFVPALVEEAAARSNELDARKMYPFPWNKNAAILGVLGAMLLGFALMPNFQLFRTPEEKKVAAALKLEGEKLIEVSKKVQSQTKPQEAETNKLAKKLEKLGQKMVRGRMTKRAALTDLGELRKQMQKAEGKNQQKPADSNMAQIAEAIKSSQLQSETGKKAQQNLKDDKFEEAAKMLDQLAEKVEKNQLSQKEKAAAAKDLEKIANELKQRSGEANKEAAQKMQDAANQLRQQNKPQDQNKNGQKQKQDGQQQQGQGQQQGQNGKKGQNQQQQGGSQGGQQGQQQQNQGGQQNQSGQQQGGQQGGGQQQGGQNQQSDGQGASDALRGMANGLRQGNSNGGNSQNLRDMLNKMQEAENGTNGGNQSGMGPMGKGGGQSGQSGEGKSMTPGKDLLPTDPRGQVGGGAGLGPRNNAQGVQSGGGVSKTKSTRTGDKRRYEDVWSDRLPKTRSKIDRVKGKWGSEGEMEQLPTKGDGKGGSVKTPYYDVYESYKSDAEEAVGRDKVPPAYKQPVKDYFESIKP